MQTKTSALLLAAFCGFAVLASGSAAAREDTGLEGHWGGDLVSLKTGEKSSAELMHFPSSAIPALKRVFIPFRTARLF